MELSVVLGSVPFITDIYSDMIFLMQGEQLGEVLLGTEIPKGSW